MLKKLFQDNILLLDKAENWEDSISKASKKLLEKNFIEERYVEKMIENIKKLGPYVIMDENIAMPHSRSEDGVLQTSLALLKLKEPVKFLNRKEEIRIIIVLAAKNSNIHIEIIEKLVNLFEDKEKIQEILKSKTEEDILKIIER